MSWRTEQGVSLKSQSATPSILLKRGLFWETIGAEVKDIGWERRTCLPQHYNIWGVHEVVSSTVVNTMFCPPHFSAPFVST